MDIKFVSVFDATPEKIDINKPDEYPALFGGRILLPNGESVIVDDVIINDEKEYEDFVNYLRSLFKDENREKL